MLSNLRLGNPVAIVASSLALLTHSPLTHATDITADITQTTRWTKSGSPYLINRAIVVTADLAIEAGVVIQFGAGGSLSTDDYHTSSITAVGTPSEPITFTSSQPQGAPGDWGGVTLDSRTDSAKTLFEQCRFLYGGAARRAMVRVEDCAPTFRSCRFLYSSSAGMEAVTTYSSSSARPSVTYCVFQHNRGPGLILDGGCTQSVIRNNSFDANRSVPIQVHCNSVGALRGNSFAQNQPNLVRVIGGQLTASQGVANMGVPFVVTSAPIVIEGAELSIEPGVVMRFDSGTGIECFEWNPGSLTAVGEPSNPILLTSNQEVPVPGDWRGLLFRQSGGQSRLEYCIVEYAGSLGLGNVTVRSGSPALRHCSIHGSAGDGVLVPSDANTYGLNPTIANSNIYSNRRFDVNNGCSKVISARNNWWGSVDGPKAVNGDVDTTGYLTSPVLLGFPRSPLLKYFPHFAGGAGWKSLILASSLEEIDGKVDLRFYNDSGAAQQVRIDGVLNSRFEVSLPAGGTKVLEVTSDTLATGWVELLPQQKVLGTLVFQLAQGSQVLSSAGVQASLIGTQFVIPLKCASGSSSIGIAIANPNADGITVRLTLVDELGAARRETGLFVPALGHIARFIGEFFAEAATWEGCLRLESELGFLTAALRTDGALVSTISAERIR